MRASLLAEPGIDERLSARCRAGVERVPDRLLVESDQREHHMIVGGEPADDPDGDVGVVAVGDPPQLVAAGLPDALEGRGLLLRPGGEVVQRLQQRDRDGQELAACSSALVSQRSNSSVQSTITCPV
jgi:hypothetical protein